MVFNKRFLNRDSFRLVEWWDSQVPRDMALIILILLVNRMNPINECRTLILLFLSIIGFRSVAYYINDWADIKEDAAAGKNNFVAHLNPMPRIVLFVVLLGSALVPWLFLRATSASWILLGSEFILFLLYEPMG